MDENRRQRQQAHRPSACLGKGQQQDKLHGKDVRGKAHLLEGGLVVGGHILVGVDGDHVALLLGNVAHAILRLVLVVLLRVNAPVPAPQHLCLSRDSQH